jgi:hypothetical protein
MATDRRDPEALNLRRGVASVLFALGACVTLLGCGGSALNRGADFYMQGRYIDAAQVFEHTEPALASYDGKQRAQYGYYRGATLLALGYTDDARHWLSYGGSFALASLSSHERRKLIGTLIANEKTFRTRASATSGAPASRNLTPSQAGASGSVPYLVTLLASAQAPTSELPASAVPASRLPASRLPASASRLPASGSVAPVRYP